MKRRIDRSRDNTTMPKKTAAHARHSKTAILHCCARMDWDLSQQCKQHPDPYDCPDHLMIFKSGEYGLIVHDGSHSYVKINYCPWCGSKLPKAGIKKPRVQ